ncbi:alanine racemase [Alphaproteobacteria bacterium LSUCC0684]
MGSSARLIARIDLDRLVANWRNLNTLSGQAEASAVIKADAYGHGVEMVGRALYQAGCRVFFTASINEAVLLRSHLGKAVIGYFDGLHAEDTEAVRAYDIWPAISSPGQMDLLADMARRHGNPIPAMLQIDTGMNRLGAGPDRLDELASSEKLNAGDWKLIFSHLASADDPQSAQSETQRAAFDRVRRLFPSIPASLAATGGIALGPAFHYQMTRPGIGIYGLPPLPSLAPHLNPALSLHARVLEIRQAKAGEHVGYNATATLGRDTRLATVAGGYADGVRRQLSNKGTVHKDGFAAPVIGRVSMDTTIVDITDWPENHLAPGDWLDLIHDGYTADDMARDSDTIGYDILTTLGLRAKRQYAGRIMAEFENQDR